LETVPSIIGNGTKYYWEFLKNFQFQLLLVLFPIVLGTGPKNQFSKISWEEFQLLLVPVPIFLGAVPIVIGTGSKTIVQCFWYQFLESYSW